MPNCINMTKYFPFFELYHKKNRNYLVIKYYITTHKYALVIESRPLTRRYLNMDDRGSSRRHYKRSGMELFFPYVIASMTNGHVSINNKTKQWQSYTSREIVMLLANTRRSAPKSERRNEKSFKRPGTDYENFVWVSSIPINMCIKFFEKN